MSSVFKAADCVLALAMILIALLYVFAVLNLKQDGLLLGTSIAAIAILAGNKKKVLDYFIKSEGK